MSQLLGLSLACLDISDEGLSAIGNLKWLERVNLRHTPISKEAIVELVNERAHSLRRLNLSNTVLDDVTLAGFPEQSQLQDVSYSDTGITDAGCEQVVRCQWLTNLRLDFTDITDDGVRFLANCTNLQSLDLFRTKVSDSSLIFLSDSKVEHLGMGCTLLTDAGMPALSDFSHLQSLDLQATGISDRGLRFLSEAPKLDRLFLENTKISNAGLESLLSLPLNSLSVNLGVDNGGLKTLSRHEKLRRLAMWNGKVTSWKPLTQLEHLQVLLVDDCVNDLSPFQRLHELKVLMLWGEFSPTEVARLRLALPNCAIKTFARRERPIDEFRMLCRSV